MKKFKTYLLFFLLLNTISFNLIAEPSYPSELEKLLVSSLAEKKEVFYQLPFFDHTTEKKDKKLELIWGGVRQKCYFKSKLNEVTINFLNPVSKKNFQVKITYPYPSPRDFARKARSIVVTHNDPVSLKYKAGIKFRIKKGGEPFSFYYPFKSGGGLVVIAPSINNFFIEDGLPLFLCSKNLLNPTDTFTLKLLSFSAAMKGSAKTALLSGLGSGKIKISAETVRVLPPKEESKEIIKHDPSLSYYYTPSYTLTEAFLPVKKLPESALLRFKVYQRTAGGQVRITTYDHRVWINEVALDPEISVSYKKNLYLLGKSRCWIVLESKEKKEEFREEKLF
ncbi:MAG: hypothetical protein D6780_08670 [Candidatus Dadabacteria bacterium]|nr:MAG: hypothetical protein D6780_08670 [Candidatus Dadabacteria bacterium]